jgi:hypothetical protein
MPGMARPPRGFRRGGFLLPESMFIRSALRHGRIPRQPRDLDRHQVSRRVEQCLLGDVSPYVPRRPEQVNSSSAQQQKIPSLRKPENRGSFRYDDVGRRVGQPADSDQAGYAQSCILTELPQPGSLSEFSLGIASKNPPHPGNGFLKPVSPCISPFSG